MKKYLVLALAFLPCGYASAQEPLQQIFAGLRPICTKMVDQSLVRDMKEFSSAPLNPAKVCDCATERMMQDPTFKRLASQTKEQRLALKKAPQIGMYLSAKYYGASMTCYGDALSVSADKIDMAP
ncbi:MAG: hypothetical protein V4633_23100 [Pseudomonadota bacterium]